MPPKNHRRDPVVPAVLNFTEAGTYIGLSRRTVERMVDAATFPVVRLSPGRLGIRRTDLDAYILANTETSQNSQTA